MAEEQFKCKTCGANLDVRSAINGVLECPYCHNVWTIPKPDTNSAALSFLRMGEHDLDTCRFDDAYEAYKKAAEIDANEPEAYLGMALARFKVQYLKDEVNNCLQPISHQLSDRKFSSDPDFMRAYDKGTESQKIEYKKRAQDIDFIQGEFERLEKSGLNYDSFICVKVSGEKGNTEDSKDAEYIYHLLKENNFNPFYSEYEIRNKQGTAYEAHILYALYKAECMLVVCRDENYLQTPWVKNEYTRFLKLVNDEEKESDAITIVFNGTPVERLPGKRGKIQGIDFSQRVSDRQIINFVYNHTPEARKKRAEEAEQKKRDEAERDKRWQEQLLKQQQAQKEEFEKQLKKVVQSSNVEVSVQQNLLSRGWQEMQSNDYENAKNYFNTVLDKNSKCAEAWRGILCADFHVQEIDDILDEVEPNLYHSRIMEDKGYKLWSEFSGENEEERRVFENFIDNMQSNLLNAKDEHEEAIEREKQWIKQAAEATDAEKAELKGRYDRAMDEYKREENFLYGKKSHFSYYCSTCGRRINTWLFLISSVLAAALFAFLLFKKYLDGEWDELPVFLGWGELVGRRWGLLIEIPVLSFAAAIIILILINITMAVVALIHNKKESERQSFYDAHSAKRDSSKIMVDGLENQIHIKERDFGERKRSADDRIANHEAYIRALDMAMEAIERS